ncbi:TolC family protein [Taibaiella lutea]|uniref:TolC family protein n=1 Tax=Taibaiella lutea TaxID=2608001 RepID=A0A5M6CQ17_9BACT|nr:TolC family protein [Taibaiella lutea]KAA5537197.1 TolC family protein [Taibaiella lutea]
MKLLLKTSMIICSLSFLGLHANAQADTTAVIHRLSVKEAVEYAEQNNVQVKNALVDILLQKQSNNEITATAYPSLAANGSFTDNLKLPVQLIPGEFLGQPAGTFIPLKFGTQYATSGSLDLSQVVFDGQVFVGLQARSTSMKWQTLNAEITKQNIKANVIKVYYQLVLSKTQIALLDVNIGLVEKQRHDTKAMYENGFAEQLDVDKNDVQLANLKTEKEKVLLSVANGYNGLKILLGMSPKDMLVLTDSLSDDQIKDQVLINQAYNYEDRKEYQYLQLTRQLNEYDIKRYQYSRLPALTLNASYATQNYGDKIDYSKDWYSSSYVGLRISVPLFKGFAIHSRVAQAKLKLQKTENQLEDMKHTIDNDVITATNNFKTAIAVMDYQKKNMELADRVYQQTKKKYEVGTGSQTEVVTAQAGLETAQSNYVNSLYDAVIARVDFLKATGNL